MKKHFIRALSLALTVLFCLPLMVGCHGSKGLPEFVMPEEFDTTRNFTISFWAKNDTNNTQVNIYKKAIADFEKVYPNVKVEVKWYTDYGRIYNDVITNIATQTTPNVCITYPDHIATYMTGTNTVVPLDILIDNQKYGLGGSDVNFDGPSKDEVIPKFLAEGVINGTTYALPYMRSTDACYINKTYVEALGYEIPEKLTWEFIWEVSEAAMEKNADGNYKVNGQKVMIPFIYKSTDNMMIQYLKQAGAGYSSDAGDILIFNETTEELLYEIASHVKTGAFSTFKISSYPGNFLNAGQCIFAIDSTAGATWIGSNSPNAEIDDANKVQFETVVMPIPQVDTENPQMISQGPSLCLFNKADPQEVLASWLFAQFLLTNEVQISYSQTEGYLPVTSKAQNSAEYKDYLSRRGEDNDMYYYVKIDAAKLLMDNIDNTFITPVFNGSASLRNAAGQLIEDTAKSVRRNEKVDEAYIANLYKDVTSLYRLDRNFVTSAGKQEYGSMPVMAVVLICSISALWIGIGIYYVTGIVKNRKK